MKYQILSRREELLHVESGEGEEKITATHKIVFTLVEYDFGGTLMTIEVPHYNPFDEEYIVKGIENLAITEQRKLGLLE
jgi:hypothetical protein